MGNALNLGRIFGIQFRLHFTWFVIFILVTVSLIDPHWLSLFHWIVAIITSSLFFASILAHELAHSLVGRALGIPIKSITLFIFGGISQMTKEATSASVEWRMAAAGPACSLGLVGVFYGLSWLTQGFSELISGMLQWLALVNGALALFNLIPGFPLDGGRVFRSLLWRFTSNYYFSTRIAVWVGKGVGYLIILGGILIILLVVFVQTSGLSIFTGLWLAFIGWFLQSAAQANYNQLKLQIILRGVVASQVMTTGLSTVSSDITISNLIANYLSITDRRYFIVVEQSRLIGIIDLLNVKSVDQSSWDSTSIKDIMTPMNKITMVSPNQNAVDILEQMGNSNLEYIAVTNENDIIGLVTHESLTDYLRIHSELGMWNKKNDDTWNN